MNKQYLSSFFEIIQHTRPALGQGGWGGGGCMCVYLHVRVCLLELLCVLQGYFTVTVLIMAHFVHSEHLYWSGNQTQPQSTSLLEPENISPGKYQCQMRPF